MDRHDKNKARRAQARDQKLEDSKQTRNIRLICREDERLEREHSIEDKVPAAPAKTTENKRGKREVRPDNRGYSNTGGR